MTASSPSRPAARHPLHMVQGCLLGALFLGAVATASLPLADWVAPWLVVAPGAALLAACALRLSQRQRATGHAAAAVSRRRPARPAMAVRMRRRASQPRRASRLLAALVLR